LKKVEQKEITPRREGRSILGESTYPNEQVGEKENGLLGRLVKTVLTNPKKDASRLGKTISQSQEGSISKKLEGEWTGKR